MKLNSVRLCYSASFHEHVHLSQHIIGTSVPLFCQVFITKSFLYCFVYDVFQGDQGYFLRKHQIKLPDVLLLGFLMLNTLDVYMMKNTSTALCCISL